MIGVENYYSQNRLKTNFGRDVSATKGIGYIHRLQNASSRGNTLNQRRAYSRPREAAAGVYYLPVRGSNVYFVRSESSWVLIDAGWKNSAQLIHEAAEYVFGPNTRPVAILLTHAHPDHDGSAAELARLWELPVHVHSADLPLLTGLYNRRYLLEEFDREFTRANRNGSSLSLVMIDLDDLKTINNRFGHNEGDIALRELARILRLNTRTSDLAARWGGDEFVLLAPDTDIKRARIIGERIRSEVEHSRPTAVDQQMAIRVSVGIASYPAHASCVTELIKRADQAMYNAKGLGKNQVCVFHNGKAEYGHMRRQN